MRPPHPDTSRRGERDVSDALAALRRLQQHGVVTLDEAQQAARFITGDETFEFPPPAPEAAHAEEGPPGGAAPVAPGGQPPA